MLFATASLFARKPNCFVRFIQKTKNLPELKGLTITKRSKKLSKMWKGLSEQAKNNLRK
jgi:hypothetical protein